MQPNRRAQRVIFASDESPEVAVLQDIEAGLIRPCGADNSAKHYDLVVIGSGAAGHHGAIQAAKLGKKVAVVERSVALGGQY